jgi:hypothetical protein
MDVRIQDIAHLEAALILVFLTGNSLTILAALGEQDLHPMEMKMRFWE